MLGIIIGIAAITLIVAIGEGHKAQVVAEIQKIGTDVIWISNDKMKFPNNAFSLSLSDMNAIRHQSSWVLAVSPILSVSPHIQFHGRSAEQLITTGVNEDYFTIMDLKPLSGRLLTTSDSEQHQRVCVIEDSEPTRQLLGQDFQLPKTIRLNDYPFTVVGIVPAKSNENTKLYIPVSTAQKLFTDSTIQMACARAVDTKSVPKAIDQIRRVLNQRYPLNPFYVSGMLDYLKVATTIASLITLVVAGIAGISLVVGGIGIMNIMLVSVSERTKEIGILKAIGAEDRHILNQFLCEAVVLSGLGGCIGLVCGIVLTETIQMFFYHALKLSPVAIVISFVFSVVVGVASGYYPARQAARLNPIDAIRTN
jgi:putative ABC transport system permease protein